MIQPCLLHMNNKSLFSIDLHHHFSKCVYLACKEMNLFSPSSALGMLSLCASLFTKTATKNFPDCGSKKKFSLGRSGPGVVLSTLDTYYKKRDVMKKT